ncbi:hypothetical protein JAGODDHD_02043 [Sphingomonas paucimobilis]|nr:hypothetical protein [Sphingomonas paucimobilis]SUJ09749.1 Uncharacterised protein [Sphingomonas paucimobilis]
MWLALPILIGAKKNYGAGIRMASNTPMSSLL